MDYYYGLVMNAELGLLYQQCSVAMPAGSTVSIMLLSWTINSMYEQNWEVGEKLKILVNILAMPVKKIETVNISQF